MANYIQIYNPYFTNNVDSVKGGTGGAETEQATGQSFFPGKTFFLSQITVRVNKNGTPSDNYLITVTKDTPTGTTIATSDNVAGGSVVTNTELNFPFTTGATLNIGQKYYFLITRDGARDTTNFLAFYEGTSLNYYKLGGRTNKANNVWGGDSTTSDLYFIIYSNLQNSSITKNLRPAAFIPGLGR